MHGFKFQSTPPRGRRRILARQPPRPEKFQSTPPRGRRPISICAGGGRGQISIHASAREATSVWVFPGPLNSFQSTPPRGRRPAPFPGRVRRDFHFNPRLRAGGDGFAPENRASAVTFQSTPPRGRRQRQVSACACKGFTGTIAGICLLMLPGFSSCICLYHYNLIFQ